MLELPAHADLKRKTLANINNSVIVKLCTWWFRFRVAANVCAFLEVAVIPPSPFPDLSHICVRTCKHRGASMHAACRCRVKRGRFLFCLSMFLSSDTSALVCFWQNEAKGNERLKGKEKRKNTQLRVVRSVRSWCPEGYTTRASSRDHVVLIMS